MTLYNEKFYSFVKELLYQFVCCPSFSRNLHGLRCRIKICPGRVMDTQVHCLLLLSELCLRVCADDGFWCRISASKSDYILIPSIWTGNLRCTSHSELHHVSSLMWIPLMTAETCIASSKPREISPLQFQKPRLKSAWKGTDFRSSFVWTYPYMCVPCLGQGFFFCFFLFLGSKQWKFPWKTTNIPWRIDT